jgi:hypothetical protein
LRLFAFRPTKKLLNLCQRKNSLHNYEKHYSDAKETVAVDLKKVLIVWSAHSSFALTSCLRFTRHYIGATRGKHIKIIIITMIIKTIVLVIVNLIPNTSL